jgi:hypothetical protein
MRKKQKQDCAAGLTFWVGSWGLSLTVHKIIWICKDEEKTKT